MTRRTFRTGDWLDKAKAAGIVVEWGVDCRVGYHLAILLPTTASKGPAAARCMVELFGCDAEEAQRRRYNITELVYRRQMKRLPKVEPAAD